MKKEAPSIQRFSMAWLVLHESVRSFLLNKGLQSAATLAYYGFLSLMPLLLLVIFLLGFFMYSSDAVLQGVEDLVADLIPAFNRDLLLDLMTLSQQKVWGLVGVIALIWSMTPFSGAVHEFIVRAFKYDKKESFFKRKMVDVAAILLLLLLLIALVVLKLYFGSVKIPLPGFMVYWVGWALPLVLTVIVIAIFYAIFAPVRLRWMHLVAGALTTTVLLSLMRPLFGLMLQYNPNYGYAFGSLKTIFLLLVWVYYTFAVLLFGAEVMANARRGNTILFRGLFSDKPLAATQRLMHRFLRVYQPDEVVFEEGGRGNEMFYILSGAVDIIKNGQRLWTMKKGDYFGEMSMLIDAPRTATAKVVEPDTQLVAVAEESFETILRENPKIVQAILKNMALRLKTTSEQASGESH